MSFNPPSKNVFSTPPELQQRKIFDPSLALPQSTTPAHPMISSIFQKEGAKADSTTKVPEITPSLKSEFGTFLDAKQHSILDPSVSLPPYNRGDVTTQKPKLVPEIKPFLPITGTSVLETLQRGLEAVGRGMSDPEIPNPHLPFSGGNTMTIAPPKKSCYFHTEGSTPQGMLGTFINGMKNTYEEAYANMKYIHSLSSGLRIDGVYNHSNHAVGDLAEVFSLNYFGSSPIT
jgi:hypothetical protein